MSPLGIVALLAGLGITGYVGYDIYKTTQTPKPSLVDGVISKISNLDGLDSPTGRELTNAEASSAERYWHDFESIF